MSNKYPTLSDYKDSRLIQKSYETESIFKRTIKTDIEKSAHKQHKYLTIKDGKYIYDHSQMTSKDHFDAAEFHKKNQHDTAMMYKEAQKNIWSANSPETKQIASSNVYHRELKEIHENLAWKKEGEERKKIKEDRIKELKKKLATSMNEKDMIKYTNEINELQGVGKNIQKSESQEKIHKVMKEFKEGKLHSGGKDGKKVIDRKQAIAIAMSEAGLSKSNDYNEEEYQKHKHHFEDEIEKSENEDYSKWTAQQHRDEMQKHQEKAYKYKESGNKNKAYEHEQQALHHKALMRDKIRPDKEKGMLQKSEAFDILIPTDFDDRIEKSKGPWKKGKNRATVYSKHKNKEVKNLDEYLDNEEINSIIKESEKIDWNDKDLDVSDITDKIQYSKYVNEILSKLKDKKLIEQDDDGWDWIDQNTGKRIS